MDLRVSTLTVCLGALLATASAAQAQVRVSVDAAPTEVAPGEQFDITWTVRAPRRVLLTAVVLGSAPGRYETIGSLRGGQPGTFRDTLRAPTTPGTLHWTIYVRTARVRGVIASRTITVRRPQQPTRPTAGAIATVAGDGGSGAVNGTTFPASGSLGGRSWGVARDSQGQTFFGLFDDGAIARLNADGTATKVVDNLRNPMVFDFSAQDDLIIADHGNDRVLRATKAAGYADATSIFQAGTLSMPGAARFGANGKIYVADTGNHRIIEVEADLSSARIVAGGRQGLAGDGGPAADAALNFPIDMDVDARGALVIADAINNRLRVVNLNASGSLTVGGVAVAAGQIETLAGRGPAGAAATSTWTHSDVNGGFSGDNGPATRARIDWPFSPRFDRTGAVWFADADNHRIRRVAHDGTIQTVAGNVALPQNNGFRSVGSQGRDVGDGRLATAADLNRPMDLELVEGASTVTLLIGDTDNSRVRSVAGLPLGPALPATPPTPPTPPVTPPTPPQPTPDTTAPTFGGVTSVTASGQTALRVRWAAARDDTSAAAAIRYRVFVATSSGGQDFNQPAATTAAGATQATVDGLTAGTRYHVVVRAVDEAGNADRNTRERSAQTQAAPDTSAPTFGGVTSVTAIGQDALRIRWSAARDDRSATQAIRYRLFVATAAGGQDFDRPTVTTSAGATEATIDGLSAGTRYHVVVRAVDEAGNADRNTRERSAQTQSAPPPPPPPPAGVSFANEVLPIFRASCVGCHRPGGIGPFALNDNVAFGNIVNTASGQVGTLNRVEPGDAQRSYLFHKVNGTHQSVGGFGSRMPLGGQLSAAEIQTIKDWIDQGARNN